MSESKKSKKKKKEVKKMSFHDFAKQAGGGSGMKSSLPSAPGELPSGPGQGGRYNNRQGGRGRYGDNDRPRSAADDSTQWRRGGDRRNTERGPRRSYGGDRDSGGFGRSQTDRSYSRRDRDRDEPSSRFDESSVSRSMFGSKKQAPTRIGNPSRDSFGSNRSSTSRISRPMDSGPSIDRSSFGRKTPLRPVSSRNNFGSSGGGYGRGRSSDFEPSSGGYGSGTSRQLKRGYFDGSGNGFGAHLVSEFFNPDPSDSPNSPNRRVNYAFDAPEKTSSSRFSRDEPVAAPPARSRIAPWGKATSAPRNQKTPEQIAQEERLKSEREDAARSERQARDAERARQREEEEAEARRVAAVKAEQEEREAFLASLREDVDSMLSGDARPLTREHLEVVMPQIEPKPKEAVILGTALAMTVNQDTVPLNEAVHMIPAKNFDTTFINMLSSLATRMGEINFVAALQEQSIDVFDLMQNKDNIKKRLLDANLKCLVGNDETQSQLDAAFSKHVSLSELYTVVTGIKDLPAELLPKVTSYIFEEYFTNRNIEDPSAWFDSYQIFDFIAQRMNGHTEIIDTAVKQWYAHGAKAAALLPMFDRLLRAEYIFAEQVSAWYADYANDKAKMAALMVDIDQNGDEDAPANFGEWIMNVEDVYVLEDEEEDDDDGMGNFI